MAEGKPAIPRDDDFQHVGRAALAGPGKSPEQNQPGGKAANGRNEQTLPPAQRFGDLDQVATVAQGKLLDRVDAQVENQVDQSADDAHAAGKKQVHRLLAQPKLFPDAQQGLPVAPEKFPRRPHDLLQTLRPGPHSMIL